MKPFLLLQHRYVDAASDNEYEAVLKYGNLQPYQLQRIRMEHVSLPEINLSEYSGIIIGGGPANVSDPEEKKSIEQRRFEKELITLYDEIFEIDFPYLGMCYGMGSVTRYLNGVVSKENYGEGAGAVTINILADANDPVLEGIPSSFRAFGGHKEACQQLPEGAVLLAGSETCPVQMIRVKQNIYATQFHPELDVPGILHRLEIYQNHGYFDPETLDELFDDIKKEKIEYPPLILRNFVQLHSR